MTELSQENKLQWYLFQHNAVLFPRGNFKDNYRITSLPSPIQEAITRHFRFQTSTGRQICCAELDDKFTPTDDWIVIPMKKALESIGPDNYTGLARAHAIINWDKNHQFCGRCGTRTFHTSNSFERHCDACQLFFYPRISPSVIVLIHHGDHLLLARGHHFPQGVYGLIAGFVEAGENIEETVHREIHEEVGITVKNLAFYSSQAWPFPDSLMIGFLAEYDQGEIIIEDRELETAGWYHYSMLPGRPSTTISIANRLIDHFIQLRAG